MEANGNGIRLIDTKDGSSLKEAVIFLYRAIYKKVLPIRGLLDGDRIPLFLEVPVINYDKRVNLIQSISVGKKNNRIQYKFFIPRKIISGNSLERKIKCEYSTDEDIEISSLFMGGNRAAIDEVAFVTIARLPRLRVTIRCRHIVVGDDDGRFAREITQVIVPIREGIVGNGMDGGDSFARNHGNNTAIVSSHAIVISTERIRKTMRTRYDYY